MKSGILAGRFAAALTTVVAGLFVGAPAAAAALPDLEVTAAVTPARTGYAVGETVTIAYTIRNVSNVPATGIKSGGDYDGLTWIGDMPWSGAFDLAPGQSRVFTWDAVVDESGYRAGNARGGFEFNAAAGEANPADNLGRFHLSVPGGKGTLRLKAFVDVRGDYDARQPALAGAEVVVTQPVPGGERVASGTTDAQGWVSFAALAPQDYAVSVVGRKLRGADGPEDSEPVQVFAGVIRTTYLPVLPVGGPTSSPSSSPSGSPSSSPSGGPTNIPTGGPSTGVPSGAAGSSSSSPVTVSPSVPASAGASVPAPASAAAPATASADVSPAVETGGLALTGSSSGPLAGLGVVAVAAGAGAFVMARRRRRRFAAE